jgi:hypothetical protein
MKRNDYNIVKNDCSDFLIAVIVPLNHRNLVSKRRGLIMAKKLSLK